MGRRWPWQKQHRGQLDLFPALTPTSPPEQPPAPSAGATTDSVPARPVDLRIPERLRSLVPTGGEDLGVRLAGALATPLASLVLTDNRSTILSARPGRRGLTLRVHWSFVDAPDEVVRALARVAAGGSERRSALAVVREHFRHHRMTSPAQRPRTEPAAGSGQGSHFDLEAIRDRINGIYFEDRLGVAIAWGRVPVRRRRPRRRRTIHLGTYRPDLGLVRVHPVLDRAAVPLFVVESVVHHEMLHADLPVTVVAGRRRLHTPEFRRRERLFADHDRAQAWIDEHLDRLLEARYRL